MWRKCNVNEIIGGATAAKNVFPNNIFSVYVERLYHSGCFLWNSINCKLFIGGNKFGPQVKETFFTAPNVYVQASKSGKLSTELFREWFTNVYVPNTGTQSALLLDSWTGLASILELVPPPPPNKKVAVYTIPKKTKGSIM